MREAAMESDKSVTVYDYARRLHSETTKSYDGKCAWGGGCTASARYSLALREGRTHSNWAACERHVAGLPATYDSLTWRASGSPPWADQHAGGPA